MVTFSTWFQYDVQNQVLLGAMRVCTLLTLRVKFQIRKAAYDHDDDNICFDITRHHVHGGYMARRFSECRENKKKKKIMTYNTMCTYR